MPVKKGLASGQQEQAQPPEPNNNADDAEHDESEDDDSDDDENEEPKTPPAVAEDEELRIFEDMEEGDDKTNERLNTMKQTCKHATEVLQLLREKQEMERKLEEMKSELANKSRQVGASVPSANEALNEELAKISPADRLKFTHERFSQDSLKERKLTEKVEKASQKLKRAQNELDEHLAQFKPHKRFRYLEIQRQKIEEFSREHGRIVEVQEEEAEESGKRGPKGARRKGAGAKNDLERVQQA